MSTMPRSRQSARSLVSRPTPWMAQISSLGINSICSRVIPAMPWEAAPRMRPPTSRSAATGSGAEKTGWTVKSRSKASTTGGGWKPSNAISTRLPEEFGHQSSPEKPRVGVVSTRYMLHSTKRRDLASDRAGRPAPSGLQLEIGLMLAREAAGELDVAGGDRVEDRPVALGHCEAGRCWAGGGSSANGSPRAATPTCGAAARFRPPA